MRTVGVAWGPARTGPCLARRLRTSLVHTAACLIALLGPCSTDCVRNLHRRMWCGCLGHNAVLDRYGCLVEEKVDEPCGDAISLSGCMGEGWMGYSFQASVARVVRRCRLTHASCIPLLNLS